jgi:hypothetical protein
MQYCGTKPAMTISLTQRSKLVVFVLCRACIWQVKRLLVLKEALCALIGKFSHF